MNAHKNVFVVVLNWNGLADTIECLNSLRKINYGNFTVVVADNGSSDNSVTVIRTGYPETIVIENRANLGYAGGNNVGIQYAMDAGADYILLLNNDTIVDSEVLSELLAASQTYNDRGIFGAKIFHYSEPGQVWYGGTQWDRLGLAFNHIAQVDAKEVRQTAYACGCALFIPASVVRDLGLMDTRFFLTYEDSDWCFRARRLGIESFYVPSARIWHKISASFGGAETPLRTYFNSRNVLLWGERHLDIGTYVRLFKLMVEAASGLRGDSFVEYSQLRRFWLIALALLRHCRRADDNVVRRAYYFGLRDYILRRFGNAPLEVVNLRSQIG